MKQIRGRETSSRHDDGTILDTTDSRASRPSGPRATGTSGGVKDPVTTRA